MAIMAVLLQGLSHARADHVAAQDLEALARQSGRDDVPYLILHFLGACIHDLRFEEKIVLPGHFLIWTSSMPPPINALLRLLVCTGSVNLMSNSGRR